MKTTEFRSSALGESYTRTVCDNGLTVYVAKKEFSMTHAVLAAKCGSLDASVRLADGTHITFPEGTAHYLEHKLFDNEDGSDSFAIFSALGADGNAYTTYDRTAFLFSTTEHPRENLKELLRFVSHPYFTPQTVKKEQGIIAEEIKMYDDMPWERGFHNLLLGLYQNHPVHDNICGSCESISRITDQTLYQFYDAFYHPSNMILSIAGPLSTEEVLSVVKEAFPGKEKHPVPQRICPCEPAAPAMRETVERMTLSKPIFQFAFKDNNISADPAQRLRRDAIATVVGDALFSKSGDFYNKLLEENLITPSFSAGYSGGKDFAFFCISGESDQPRRVEEELFSYLSELSEKGISEEDLERSRRVLYADEIRSYDSTEEVAQKLLSFALDDADPFGYPALLTNVTKQDADELLCTLFQKEFFALSIVEPTKERRS